MWKDDQVSKAAQVLKDLDNNVRDTAARLNTLTKARDELKWRLQVNCAHVFTPPMKGYEHEGGVCSKCSVGELYAPTLRQMHKDLIDTRFEDAIERADTANAIADQYIQHLSTQH